MVLQVHNNATYSLRKLDGTRLKVLIVGKRVKIFKQRYDRLDMETIANEFDLFDDVENDEEVEDQEVDEVHEDDTKNFGEVV